MGVYSYGYKAGKKILKKVFKPQKTTGTEVVNPFQRKKMRSDAENIMGGLKVDLGKFKGKAKKLQTSVEDVKAAIKDRARVKKMGGGMMGRRMGYASGTLKPIPADNKGLPKLPKKVRNKMGFMKKGGRA